MEESLKISEILQVIHNAIGVVPDSPELEDGKFYVYATPLVNKLPGPDDIEFIRTAIADTGFILSEFLAASSLSPLELRSGSVEGKLDGPDEDPENWGLSVRFTFTIGYEGEVILDGPFSDD